MEHVKLIVMVLGGLAVIVLPTLVGIMWTAWGKLSDALNSNTKAIIQLEAKLGFLWGMTQEIPKIKSDINAAHEKIRNKDKDRIIDD